MTNCPYCNTNVDKQWEFCPKCGSHVHVKRDVFSDMFTKVFDEFKDMNKVFERDVEAMDISPWFRKPKGSGFSIKIVTSGSKQPKVSVRTYGDVDQNRIKKELYNQLGVPEEKMKEEKVNQDEYLELKDQKKPQKTPKLTEEAKADIRKVGEKVIVELQLPGAKADEIDINELESSVEVKAVVGEKAYFKILTKPQDYRLFNQNFKNGVLHLEFA